MAGRAWRIGPALAGAALASSLLTAAHAVPAADALDVQVVGQDVLTLPAADGFQDATRVRVVSARPGRVDVVAKRRKDTVRVADDVALRRVGGAWQARIVVPIRPLARGAWNVRARRSDGGAAATAPDALLVGSGRATEVSVVPDTTRPQPYADGVLDSVWTEVVATDETGTALPIEGRLRLTAGKRTRTMPLRDGAAGLRVTGLRLGEADLTASVQGPAGSAVTGSTALVLEPTDVDAIRLAMTADTVQPVADGLLDSVVFTTSGTARGGSPAPVRGTMSITRDGATVATWPVTGGDPGTFAWNGRVNGVIVPGAYTARLALRGPEGATKTRTRTVTVTKDHLPYRVRHLFTVADGDQQGLAVHNGMFYVSSDVGGGLGRIDLYNGDGTRRGTIGPLPIGHAAELSYSTTTGLLYAANGGPLDGTKVWAIDPAAQNPESAIRSTFDLSALGPHGMVGVDDTGGRLIVFAGQRGAFTVTPVGFDGTVGTSVPVTILGTPQGIELVGGELWIYTSRSGRNHLTRFTVTGDAVIAANTGSAAFDLMEPGEGEGLAVEGSPDPANPLSAVRGAIYVGVHGPNRVGVLEPVADE